MADIPVGAATNIVQRVVDRGIREARYLCHFNEIVEVFETEKKNLEAKQRTVEVRADHAKNGNENISDEVKHWLEKATSLTRKDTQTRSTCFFGCFPNCISRFRQGKDLVRKTEDIKKLITDYNNGFQIFAVPSEFPEIEYYSSKDFVKFDSRQLAYERLLQALKDGDTYMIGLQGIGGAGKTTLAIEVGNEVKKLFEHVIKVAVSTTPNIKNIQHEIATPLGLKLEKEQELDRPKRLWQRLTNGEKILIILDDVWDELNFKEIGIPSDNDHSGCRVLLTTRDIKVCKSMGCGITVELELLSEEDAWVLFQKCAGLGQDSPGILKNKGQEIAKECKGLPIAIAAIASILKGQEEKEWDLALRCFQSIDHNDEDLIKVYKRLQISYDYLKGKEAKELFLLCSVFPEDYEIFVEDLTIYAIGLGLYEGFNSFEEARDRLHRDKKKLIDCCLLLKVNERQCVKMHDLLRDLAHWMEKGKIDEIMEAGSNLKALQERAIEKKSALKYLYCHNIQDLSNLSDPAKLEILILKFGYEMSVINMPETFFEGMKDLKVCTLDGKFHGKIPSLPKSTEVLKSLRALTLRRLDLDDISILEKLQKLESLRLEYCSIHEVPSGIVKLKKLKLLSLKYSDIEKDPYEVIGQIVPQLEELYLVRHNGPGQVDDEVVTKLLNKNRTSPSLQRYHIQLAEKYGWYIPEDVSISTALSIAHFDASASNTTIKDLVKRAEILHLHKIQGGYKAIIPDFVEAIEGMNALIEIKLKSCCKIEFLIDTTKDCSSAGTVFSKLKSVVLEDMGHLKSIIKDGREEKCKEIVKNDHDQLRLFPELRDLKITDCPNFEGLMSVSSNERQLYDATASSEPQASNSQCSHPFDIPPCFSRQSLISRNIRRMDIIGCKKLTSLFAVSIVQTMLLEKLRISGCDGLKHIIVDDNNDPDCKKYTFVMAKLKHLDVASCCQLKCVFGQSHHENHLSYHNIQSEIDFPALEHLSLFHLPNIISICQNNYHPKWLALQKFYLMECPQFTITTISDFMGYSDERQSDCLIRKNSGVNTRHMHTLEQLVTPTSKKEPIFCQHVISTLKFLMLQNLSGMSHIFKGPEHLKGSLENLISLSLIGCEILKVIISTSWVRSLPQLIGLAIINCEALEQIVEEDEENQNISNPCFKQVCFPKLKRFLVKNCSKLKCLFRMDTLNEFPKLEELVIMKASNLKEVFGVSDECEREGAMQNNVLPKLKLVMLAELPSLTNVWAYKLQTVEHLFVVKCPKISLTSTITVDHFRSPFGVDERGVIQIPNDEPGPDALLDYQFLFDYILRSLDEYLEPEADPERKLCSSQTQNIKRKEKIIITETRASEMPAMASASTDSELIKTSSELGNEELINEACLVDHQQQAIGETKDSVEKETKQSSSRDALEEDKSTNESGERVEKPSDVAQDTSLLSNKTMTKHVMSGRKPEKAEVKDGETIANPPPAPLIIPLQKQSALELVEKESSNETNTMDQMAFGKAKFDQHSKDSQNNMKGSVQEDSLSHVKTETSSKSEKSTSDLLVASLCETSPHDFLMKGSKESISMDALQEDKSTNETSDRVEKPSDVAQMSSSKDLVKGPQTETYLDEDIKEDSLDPQNLMDDILSLFDSMEKDSEVQEPMFSVSVIPSESLNLEHMQLVAKALADLEAYLNLPLKDIANLEINSSCLENALKFLSSWSSENEASLEALKATIDSLLQKLPTILSSFKQASATIDKFTVLEEKHKSMKEELPRQKEAAKTFQKSRAEAHQKEADLKEKIYRLQAELRSAENEMKEHKVHLSSLKEKEKKLHVDTISFSKELETAKKDKSEMVEDRSKAREQLLKAKYEWMALGNQLKQNCSAIRNLF